jgi:hypothetical protein
VRFLDGTTAEVPGWISSPFGIYWGTQEGPERGRREYQTLVFVPAVRPLATLRTAAHCKALAAELSRLWVRWGGQEPVEDPAPVIERHQRESV